MAASFKEIPGELRKSIIHFLGTPEVVLQAAQFSLKSKTEDIVLALMSYRAFVLQPKLPLKVQVSFSFLEVRLIRIKDANQHHFREYVRYISLQIDIPKPPEVRTEHKPVVIETDASSYEFGFLSLDELEEVVIHMVVSLKKSFPDSSPGHLVQNAPSGLLEIIQGITTSMAEALHENQSPCEYSREVDICSFQLTDGELRQEKCPSVDFTGMILEFGADLPGGFLETYAALCDYSGLPFQEGIQWVVDNIYHKQQCREFNIQDFSHLLSQDVALSVSALSCNRWFTRLSCRDFKLSMDILEQIFCVLSQSVTLEELVLENCGLKFDFAQEMALVVGEHSDSALNTINLAGNPLEDRGISALSQTFEKPFKNLCSLNFARTSMTVKGMMALSRSLVFNELFRISLRLLDLSGNPGSLATEDAGGLFSFLSQPNALGHLNLSETDCALDMLFGALCSGCCGNLIHLNLSRNVYSHKKNRDVPFAISKFFSKAALLQHVSLAGTKLPPEALRAVLQGLAYNTQLSGLHLDISCCELRSAGAQVIQDLVSDASSIHDLNLSDNGFDSDMVTLVLAVSRSRSIKHVALGKNFSIRSRESLVDVLHRIAQLMQDDDSHIESLSVAESRLKFGTGILLDSLWCSSHLLKLDISGNAMGDVGAKSLARALSTNTTLRTLIWDRNNTTVCGFLEVARALERNFTLKTMPLPLSDVMQSYRNHPEKTEEVVHKIQSYLARNQLREPLPQEESQLLPDIASSEQVIKDLCRSVQDYIKMLSSVQEVKVKADILWAEEAIKDATLSLGILPFLSKAGSTLYQNGKLEEKLESLLGEVTQICSREIQTVLNATVDTTQFLCPEMCQKSHLWDHVIQSIPEKAFLDQLLTEIYSKLMEIHLSITQAMARGLIDKTVEELSIIHDKLARNFPKPTEILWTVNADWNALEQKCGSLRKDFQNSKSRMAAQRSPTCSMNVPPTPAPKSLHLKVEAEDQETRTPPAVLWLSRACTKSRPVSTKDAEAEIWLPPCTESTSAQSLMDLPTAGERLEHYTRDRPRPNRRNRQPPSKANVQPSVRENDEDRSIARLDEGLDEFFTKKVIHEHLPPVSSEASPATVTTPAPSGSRTLKKKLGHFFAFKKPKSSRSPRQEKEPEGGSPSAARGRKLMLSDILRAPGKASESTKVLSKSEEGGLAVDSRGHLDQSQTPDSGRRARAKYSREGKSQSLILLSGEDEETLGVRHEKKRPFERSDGELPSSFEQRVHVMLQRIGVTKVLSSEGKKKQSKDGEIKKAGSDGDIVDCSIESPPCALKSRTHSMSTDPTVRIGPTDVAGRTGTDPSAGSSEGRLSWKALGKQLNAELKGKCSELSSSPKRGFALPEPASPREQKSRESWSSSLPRIGRSAAGPSPIRRTSNAGDGQAFSELQNSFADGNTIAEDNQFKPKPRLKPVVNRRAMSVHEEQLRDQSCVAELHHVKIPLCLQRSPILKWKIKPKSLPESETAAPSESPGTPPQERSTAATESKPRLEVEEELQPIPETAQNTALHQRTAVPLPESPTREH